MPSHDDFDGYRKWLNITSPRRPPTHYELLGVKLDEDDHEVIQAAIEQRRNFVGSKRGIGHDDLVAEILMRIDEAGITLLNPEMRREYDRQMDLFEKRKKNRRVDPLAPQPRITSRPGRIVGEDNGIVKTFAGIVAVLCVAFAGMAFFAFKMLPSSKQPEQIQALPAVQVIEPAQVAEAPAPVAPKAPEKSNERQKDDATAKVIKAIQGEWFIFSSEIQGKPFDSKKAHVTIDGNTMKSGDRAIVNDFVLDASNGHFDYSLREKNGNLKDAMGIYEFDGSTFKMCYRYNVDGTAQRPTEFKTDDGRPNVTVFHTFKREETRDDGEDAAARRSLSRTEKIDDSGDLKSMQGEWTATEEELNGKTFDQKTVSTIARHMSVKENSLLISQMWGEKIGDRLTSHTGEFRIDPATHAFDFFAKASNEANVEFRGIYKLDGDMLTLCYKYAKDFTTPRPTEYRTDAISGTVFAKTVFRRDGKENTPAIETFLNLEELNSSATEYKKTGCRVVWRIAENGESSIIVSRPLKNRSKATDSLIRHDDGTVEFQHDFASNDACRKASVGKLLEGVHFSEQHHALVFAPPNNKSTIIRYSKVAKLPVTIEFEIDKIDLQTHFGINLVNNRTLDYPTLQIDFDDQVSFSCTRFFVDADKKKSSQLGVKDNAELKTPKEFHFKLHVMADESYLPSIGTSGGSGSLGFLSVRGRLSPAFGVDFEISTKDEVIAKSVVPESLGDSIGIKVRDVIESINGEMPQSQKKMADLLAKIQFGEQAEIVVKRNGKTVKIGFTAE